MISFFFFFNDTATTEIYTLSLHDALPIYLIVGLGIERVGGVVREEPRRRELGERVRQREGDALKLGERPPERLTLERPDRKSTRLNSSHANISYAVFCLKKKKN